MRRISAVLLSAGRGSRSGGIKPLLLWRGESFLTKVYKSLVGSKAFQEIVVVTGFETEKVVPELRALGAAFVHNPQFDEGMHGSIKLGLRSLRFEWEAAMIALVDQPHLEAEDYAYLVGQIKSPATKLMRPAWHGEMGNPSLLGAAFLQEILREPNSDRGCAYLFKRHPDAVVSIEMPNEKCLIDFDTPQQLEEYADRYLQKN